jgi:hypothetical protein
MEQVVKVVLVAALLASALPVAADDKSGSYDTEPDAVVAAFASAVQQSAASGWEYGGLIMRCGASYRFGEPVTSQSRTSLSFKAQVARGCTAVAMYHTHPTVRGKSLPSQSAFSPNDMHVAKQLGLRSYMVHLGDGIIRLYEPSGGPSPNLYSSRRDDGSVPLYFGVVAGFAHVAR